MMQVAAMHAQPARGGGPVAVMSRDGITDDAALEFRDLIAKRRGRIGRGEARRLPVGRPIGVPRGRQIEMRQGNGHRLLR